MNALQIVGGQDYDSEELKPVVPKPDYSGPDHFWLNNVPLMTFFLAQQANSKNPMLAEFCLAERRGPKNATNLITPEGNRHWVDPKDFSRTWSFHTTLITSEEFEKKLEEEKNDQSNQDNPS